MARHALAYVHRRWSALACVPRVYRVGTACVARHLRTFFGESSLLGMNYSTRNGVCAPHSGREGLCVICVSGRRCVRTRHMCMRDTTHRHTTYHTDIAIRLIHTRCACVKGREVTVRTHFSPPDRKTWFASLPTDRNVVRKSASNMGWMFWARCSPRFAADICSHTPSPRHAACTPRSLAASPLPARRARPTP